MSSLAYSRVKGKLDRNHDTALLKCGDVAILFSIDTKKALEWARAGRMKAYKNTGGEWRFPVSEVRKELGYE